MNETISAHDARPVALEVAGLRKVYETKRGAVEALQDITFDIREGEFTCLVGPSGSGKTTLLKCIAGLLPPTAGTVTLGGSRVSGPTKGMAVVFQEYGRSLLPWLSVGDNIELPLRAEGVRKRARRAAMEAALHSVGLGHVADRYPWQLSGGMQQRVAIARAVASDPKVLLMDEPFAAVDAQTRAELEDMVRRVWRELGVTILFITHDIEESVYLAERVITLSGAPTVVQDDLRIDLPGERDQIGTRSLPRFIELRTRVHQQVQLAKGIPAGSL